MPQDASGDERLPHADDVHPDIATLMIARAFAETYRDVLDAPVPEALVSILRQMESRDADHERPPSRTAPRTDCRGWPERA
jgi:hypothetical protein